MCLFFYFNKKSLCAPKGFHLLGHKYIIVFYKIVLLDLSINNIINQFYDINHITNLKYIICLRKLFYFLPRVTFKVFST